MIKFGMKLPEIFNQLVRGYQKVKGVEPKGLDLIKIKQEAVSRFKDMNKVVDMEGKSIDTSKGIMGGKQAKAMGGRIGLKDGEGIMKMASMEENEREFMRLVEEFMEQGFSQQEAIEEAKDTLERKSIATGGRAGFKDGEGIMQMATMENDYEQEFMKLVGEFMENGFSQQEAIDAAKDEIERLRDKFVSAPDPMDERNTVMENIAISEFGKPLKDLGEDEIIQIEEMMEEMTKIDRGAPSITLADGGRAEFKDGLSSKLNKKFTIDGGTLRSMFFNKNNPILTGFNVSELVDLAVRNIGPAIGLAEGGRAAFKDGPKDPRRRGFMKAAVGIASMLPFGIGKGVKMAKPAIEKAVDISGPALAKVVETVMSLGKTISQSGKRVKEMITKKRHKGVEVEEDIMDGSYTIKKGDKEIYFKPGRQDEMGIDDDIIEVIEKTVTKKASGGVARLLGE